MREILFKAKRISNGEWVEGSYVYTFNEDKVCPVVGVMKENNWIVEKDGNLVLIDKDTICQYTGLNDKKGNKIWENDIVERVDRRNGLYVFREQPKMNCKVVWTDRHGYDTEPSCGYFDKKNALECSVIGNIFDNADLLKGE